MTFIERLWGRVDSSAWRPLGQMTRGARILMEEKMTFPGYFELCAEVKRPVSRVMTA
jgi:hypothetical protein